MQLLPPFLAPPLLADESPLPKSNTPATASPSSIGSADIEALVEILLLQPRVPAEIGCFLPGFLPLISSRPLQIQSQSQSFSALASRIPVSALDDDSLRPFEKELKEKAKLARQLISESKESFDTQLKIQKLKDTIFAVQEQLHKARKLGFLSSFIAAGSNPKPACELPLRRRSAEPSLLRFPPSLPLWLAGVDPSPIPSLPPPPQDLPLAAPLFPLTRWPASPRARAP